MKKLSLYFLFFFLITWTTEAHAGFLGALLGGAGGLFGSGGGIFSALGSIFSMASSLFGGGGSPDVPSMPQMQAPPPAPSPTQSATELDAAADKARHAAESQKGTQATMLTEGGVQNENVQKKTLLGA